MNKDQAKGKFEQIKGQAKAAWGELTNNDLKKAEGSLDRLQGVLQEKVGDAKEAVRSQAAKLRAKAGKGSCCG